MYSLGEFYFRQGLYTLAEPWYKQCVSKQKSRVGENHPDTASSLNNLALLYSDMGRYEEAEPIFIQAVEIAERVLGESHPDTVKCRNNLEELRIKQGAVNSEQ